MASANLTALTLTPDICPTPAPHQEPPALTTYRRPVIRQVLRSEHFPTCSIACNARDTTGALVCGRVVEGVVFA